MSEELKTEKLYFNPTLSKIFECFMFYVNLNIWYSEEPYQDGNSVKMEKLDSPKKFRLIEVVLYICIRVWV